MDYLNTTIQYLNEQNKQLKQKLKKMNDLNQIINKQRKCEQKSYIIKFHQQEINVIRQMAQQNQGRLKKQINKLLQQISELNEQINQEKSSISILKKQFSKIVKQNEELRIQRHDIKAELLNRQKVQQSLQERYNQMYNNLQAQYINRQKEYQSISNEEKNKIYLLHKDEVNKLQKNIKFIQTKLFYTEQQTKYMKKYNQNLSLILKQNQTAYKLKQVQLNQSLAQLKQQNRCLKYENQQKQICILNLNNETNKLQQELMILNRQNAQYQKQKQIFLKKQYKNIQNERYKNDKKNDRLKQQIKHLIFELERKKKNQKLFNESKKQLLNKIRQKEVRNQNDQSFYSRSKSKKKSSNKDFNKSLHNIAEQSGIKSIVTAKKGIQTFQSISLDNSFNRQNNANNSSVRNQKKIKLRQNLTINTRLSQSNILKVKDLETPCFEQSRDKHLKKTIKIRK